MLDYDRLYKPHVIVVAESSLVDHLSHEPQQDAIFTRATRACEATIKLAVQAVAAQ